MPSSSLSSDSARALAPLAGVTIVELAAIGPVPFSTHILRQMGASIIVIAPPQDRGLGLPIPPQFDYLNAEKTVIPLDLKSAEGIAALHDILRTADVLVEGFRPGTLERLSLAPEYLRASFPALILGRCSGWARQSPCSAQAGHDINYLALSGVLGAIGERTPLPPLNLVGDYGGAGMHLAVGVLGALFSRQKSGQGAVVDTSIVEGGVALMTLVYGLSDAGQWQSSRSANVLDGGAPYYRCYRTADGRWMALGAIERKFFAEFVGKIEADIDIDRQHDRAYWPAMQSLIGERLLTRTRDQWSQVFEGTDCCCTPVLNLDEARNHVDMTGLFDARVPKPAITFTHS